jgi:hypothetical protein
MLSISLTFIGHMPLGKVSRSVGRVFMTDRKQPEAIYDETMNDI